MRQTLTEGPIEGLPAGIVRAPEFPLDSGAGPVYIADVMVKKDRAAQLRSASLGWWWRLSIAEVAAVRQ